MRHTRFIYFLAQLSTVLGCSSNKGVDEATLLSAMQQQADLVVTEVGIRKIAYYDSGSSDHIVLTDPSTWRIGERQCIVPVDVWIRYGYDLRSLSLDAVRIDNEHRVVVVRLPAPRVVDSGYRTDIDESEVVSISTGLRDPIGHETIEAMRRTAYEEVMRQDFTELIGREVRYNAESVLGSIVRSLGFEQIEFEEI